MTMHHPGMATTGWEGANSIPGPGLPPHPGLSGHPGQHLGHPMAPMPSDVNEHLMMLQVHAQQLQHLQSSVRARTQALGMAHLQAGAQLPQQLAQLQLDSAAPRSPQQMQMPMQMGQATSEHTGGGLSPLPMGMTYAPHQGDGPGFVPWPPQQ